MFERRRGSDPFEEVEKLVAMTEVDRTLKALKVMAGGQKYVLFEKPEDRREIVNIGRTVCAYLHSNGIHDIVFVDRAARPGYVTMAENWRKMYPKEKTPNIYFMNPKGFKSQEESDDLVKLFIEMLDAKAKNDRVESPELIRTKAAIRRDLFGSYPGLFEGGRKTVLLFDNCIHSGDSLRPMLTTLRAAGLNVKLGLVQSEKNTSGLRPDLLVLNKPSRNGCYPFEHDELVEKTYERITAFKSLDETKRLLAFQARKEIRMAVGEHYK